ncbi:hypothetical protein ACQPZF_26875 [Actinosynnema sp. CS-041913]|uniref:hypothetical protein n=1 Tax=Actinosynnema sp. CS-041913 TaxID=3239917 RepID=UPI003D8EE580
MLLRQAGDRLNECLFLNELGETLRIDGNLPEALATFRQALALATTMNHPHQTARAHTGIANCIPRHAAAAHHARARAILTELDVGPFCR